MAKHKTPKRAVHGIILLDKPQGLTSNQALQAVKRLFNAAKAGHTGSLDPLATGMLPICLGYTTKFSQYLLEADKTYEVIAKLGEKTATGDAEGEVIEQKPVPSLDDEALEAYCEKFRGLIEQVPSMYSAVKVNGQPLYKLARQGIEIERPSRQVRIDELTLTGRTDDTLSMRVACSKGTYIRTLVEDLGEAMGCGAHVTLLRRTCIGALQAEQMLTLEALEALAEQSEQALDSSVIHLAQTLTAYPAVNVSRAAYYYLQQGQAVALPEAPLGHKWLQLQYNGQFVGMGERREDGKIAPARLLRPQSKDQVA